MSPIDTAILIVVGVSAAIGLWRGLSREVLSLLSWVVALVVAWLYSEPVAGWLAGLIESGSVRYITAFCLLFLAVMATGALIIRVVAKVLDLTGLTFFDRVLGAVFGVARGLVIVLVTLFLSHVLVSHTGWWQESVLIPYGMQLIDRDRQVDESLI